MSVTGGLAEPARLRRAARVLAGSGALAAAVFATTAAMPATAQDNAGHGHQASPAAPDQPARRTVPAVPPGGSAPRWIHIAAGGSASGAHTCGIQMGNTLWCWGASASGELGTGQTVNQDLPQQITHPTAGWASVTAGYTHTCATRTDGALWCWGGNGYGELGIGTTTRVSHPHQVTAPAATGWASVTAADYHTCATRTDTTLWCWGANIYGELGIGNTTSQDLPQQVTAPAATGWASVTAGGFHTCATRTDGTLWCWGANTYGGLGTGNTTSRNLPQQVTVPAATGWASVTAGGFHTCATRTDTTLWCWGANGFDQLGTGNTTDQKLPYQDSVPTSTGWASVAAGWRHTCATRTDGTLWCWGWGGFGQLGTGSWNIINPPGQIQRPASTGWSLITLGGRHTCATRPGHTLWCWGGNTTGELGIGSYTAHNLPQEVTS